MKMDNETGIRLSISISEELLNRLDNLQRISGKSRNAIVRELINHSIDIAEEHYEEIRRQELYRLEKERKKPYHETD